MIILLSRRNFLKKNLLASVSFLAGYNFFKDFKSYLSEPSYPEFQKLLRQSWLVKKELYVPSPEPRVGVSVAVCYKGSGLRREETRYVIRTSDWAEKPRRRYSPDNGRSWSEWEEIDEEKMKQGDYTMEGGASQEGTGPYDPVSHRRIKPVFQRIVRGDPKVAMSEIWKGNRLFTDHGYYQLSDDDGKTWGEAYMLRYEDGPGFDQRNWADERYYRTNEMYIGNAMVAGNGSVIICATVPVPFMDEEDRNAPSIFPNNYREGCVGGAMCFVGKWNESVKNYEWQTSKPVFLPRRVSTRGLDELHINELSDGRLFMTIRGSNSGLDPLVCPGRKWFSVSDDGGLTWSEVRDIRYNTGEKIYSPASMSASIRSSENGKLYWIGNISEKPVEGNSPRYPLIIIEIDEEKVCFKKDTLTIIDDRDPEHDSESLQLSNFSILENRETNEIEIYLTRLGENGGGADIWTAGAYKYTLKLQ
jgi:hypothetical protein